ncbi:MAG: glucosidase, partial [Verrucomicrobiota bacterium]
YDQVLLEHKVVPIKVRSLVGLLPLIAVSVIEEEQLERLPGFRKRFEWFLANRKDLARCIIQSRSGKKRWLISAVPFARLQRILSRLLDPDEFLSPYGIRSLSKYHEKHPFTVDFKGHVQSVSYAPGESQTLSFGGNSNWRGPIWFPINYLIIEALDRYYNFYGESLKIEYPTGSGNELTLKECANDIRKRLVRLFKSDENGLYPWQDGDTRYNEIASDQPRHQFFEYFNPETGKGHGANHQTGWTALVATLIQQSYE